MKKIFTLILLALIGCGNMPEQRSPYYLQREASSNGGKGREIFQFDIYNCCGAGRYKSPKEIEASDSSFLVKLQGGNWIYYHEPKDSLAFFIKDSLDFYLITHFRKNVGPIDYLMPRKEAPCPLEYNCVS